MALRPGFYPAPAEQPAADTAAEVCDILDCTRESVATAELGLAVIQICRRHVALTAGGAIWVEMLKPEVRTASGTETASALSA